jgi:hypothetical protein
MRTEPGPIPNAAVDPVPKMDVAPPLIAGLLIRMGVVDEFAKMILPWAIILAAPIRQIAVVRSIFFMDCLFV